MIVKICCNDKLNSSGEKMKKTIVVFSFILLTGFTNQIFSQGKFKIGLSSGIVIRDFDAHQLGFGTLATFSYMPCESIGLFLSSGIITWNNMSYYKNIYNVKITPIIFGTKYYLNSNNFRPFFLFEIEKIFGTRVLGFGNLVHPVLPGEPEPPGFKEYEVRTADLDGFALAAGFGFVHKLGDNFDFEASFVSDLWGNEKAEGAFHMKFFVGFNYIF